MRRFLVTVAAIVCGLFLFIFIAIAITQLPAFKGDPLHITLDNGSTANYYDPAKRTSADSATEVANAFARADAQAKERAASR